MSSTFVTHNVVARLELKRKLSACVPLLSAVQQEISTRIRGDLVMLPGVRVEDI
jgi:hypothetical protein